MTIEVLRQRFSIIKAREVPQGLLSQPFVFLGRTDQELSLVCPTELVPPQTEAREDGWRGFRIAGQLEFSLIGILARISTLLAEAQVGIFVVSTFDTDYIFVKEYQLDAALRALKSDGITVEHL